MRVVTLLSQFQRSRPLFAALVAFAFMMTPILISIIWRCELNSRPTSADPWRSPARRGSMETDSTSHDMIHSPPDWAEFVTMYEDLVDSDSANLCGCCENMEFDFEEAGF